MFYLIGLAHRAQARTAEAPLTDSQEAFANCLGRTIEHTRPSLIAEEDSEEALAERHAVSIAKWMADEKRIEHRFCDPTQQERCGIGYRDGQSLEIELFMRDQENLPYQEIRNRARAIEIGRYFPIRERFWLSRLGECRDRDVVFVCGDAHIEGFGKLLDREGIPYRVVERGIGWTQEDAWLNKVMQYLREHPELLNG